MTTSLSDLSGSMQSSPPEHETSAGSSQDADTTQVESKSNDLVLEESKEFGPEFEAEAEAAVKEELKYLQAFVGKLKMDDIKGGQWFEKLLAYSLSTYTKKVDAQYFRTKYPNLPTDAVVDARIQMAARYAAIQGAISSASYTGAVAATIGSAGGASPLALPAGGAAFVIDMSYMAQAQIKLAWDISVLYNVPLDVEDPDDLWKLVRIAFAVKVGEGVGGALVKGVPEVVRQVLKKYYSKSVLQAAKALPVVGKHLLQRNVIKFAIPGITVPITTAVNFWTTKISGNHAREVFRNEAALIEHAGKIIDSSEHHIEILWAMWAVASANEKSNENQRILIHHVALFAREQGLSEELLSEFRNIVEIDQEKLRNKLEALQVGAPVFSAALETATYAKNTEATEDMLRLIADASAVEYPGILADNATQNGRTQSGDSSDEPEDVVPQGFPKKWIREKAAKAKDTPALWRIKKPIENVLPDETKEGELTE